MEDIDKWKELYESGLSFDKIAAMFGCSYKKGQRPFVESRAKTKGYE